MNTKLILFVSCFAAMALFGSVKTADARSFSGSSGFSGGGSRGGSFHSGPATSRTGPGFARPGSRFGSGNFRNFHRFRHRFFDDDDFFFFGDPFFFGAPFFYPFGYGYYPYGYPPPYGYYPYSGYGSYYDQSGYAGGGGLSVVEIQRRLARAGYYHGRIDGVMGPRTRSAMRAYQRDHRVTER
jgi:hypothetical protein